MHRFFASKSQFSDSYVTIQGDDVKHISKVLRLRPGDKISVCDKEKTDYICEIKEINKDTVIAEIEEKSENPNESSLEVTLYQGLPKGEKMDYIIQKCVELGVCNIVPVIMKRTVVKPQAASSKTQRWQRIAEEAAKQCMRGIIPHVEEPVSFETMLERLEAEDLVILPYENEKCHKLKDVLKQGADKRKIGVIIGPEGGFEEEEVESASRNGAQAVTLGPRILRCETAPVATISALMYELGDW